MVENFDGMLSKNIFIEKILAGWLLCDSIEVLVDKQNGYELPNPLSFVLYGICMYEEYVLLLSQSTTLIIFQNTENKIHKLWCIGTQKNYDRTLVLCDEFFLKVNKLPFLYPPTP